MLAAAWTVYSEKGTIVLSNEKVIAKIQKLFARKESNFAAEAETALLMAQKLMLQHNISIADIPEAHEQEVVETAVKRSQTPTWHGAIADIIARNFRCKIMWRISCKTGKRVRYVVFIGLTDDVAVVSEAYSYAIALVRYNMRCIKKSQPQATTAYANTYIMGFIDGLEAKFQEQVERESWGLVLVTPALVQAKFDSLHPVEQKNVGRKAQCDNNPRVYKKGYQDGRSFDHTTKRIADE